MIIVRQELTVETVQLVSTTEEGIQKSFRMHWRKFGFATVLHVGLDFGYFLDYRIVGFNCNC